MKVIHFVLGRASQNTANGVNKVVAGLAKYSIKNGHETHVIGLSSSQKESYALVKRDGFEVESFNKFSKGAFSRIKELAKDCDIVHLHSVWNNYNLVVAAYLRRINKPYVITAHSGLTDDRLKQSRYWFKRCYHYLFQKKMFDSAAGVQALTREESTNLRKHTNNTNIFVVQNGQDLDGVTLEPKHYIGNSKTINIGFIGRLSVEKNIDGLISALALLPSQIKKNITLHLIGPNKVDKPRLMATINDLGLENDIVFEGALYAQNKHDVLSSLDFYIHPAFSDVVSIAVMEAMSLGLPSVITRTSDMSYFYNSGAFIMVEPDPKDIARGIIEMVNKRDEWSSMSQKAVNLVNEVFNWDVVVEKLLLEYKSCIEYKK
jgi:glycosyltransferase involved in cell wall biosynthesis